MPTVKEDRRNQARGMLAQFHASGLTQRAFARQEGVSLSTLTYWLRRERLEQQLSGSSALVEVTPPAATPSRGGFVVAFNGFRIEVPRDVTADEWKRMRDAWSS